MGIFDFFKKDKRPEKNVLEDLTLPKLKTGYMVDYDLKTWEVTAHNIYDWGGGDMSHEWQIKSEEGVYYLEMEGDDVNEFTLNQKIPFSRLGGDVRAHILEHDDPPDEIEYEGRTFYLEESAAGHFLKDGEGVGQPMLKWEYEDEAGETYLGIEQWGEDEFEASIGWPVEEYQFTNILPREA